MTHKSSHIIIGSSFQEEFDNLPEDKKEQIQEVLEKANEAVDNLLEG